VGRLAPFFIHSTTTTNEDGMTDVTSHEHKPRERVHAIDPPTVTANSPDGRYVVYRCVCGTLHRVAPATFKKRAA
jgi:hypothetical protein